MAGPPRFTSMPSGGNGFGMNFGGPPQPLSSQGQMRPPPSMPLAPSAGGGGPLKNSQVTTVFVDNISEKADNEFVKQMLEMCGTVVAWKRVIGVSGKLQGFGFCDFEEPEDTLRALRVLNEFQLGDKKLIVKVEQKHHDQLKAFAEKEAGQPANPNSDQLPASDKALRKDENVRLKILEAIEKDYPELVKFEDGELDEKDKDRKSKSPKKPSRKQLREMEKTPEKMVEESLYAFLASTYSKTYKLPTTPFYVVQVRNMRASEEYVLKVPVDDIWSHCDDISDQIQQHLKGEKDYSDALDRAGTQFFRLVNDEPRAVAIALEKDLKRDDKDKDRKSSRKDKKDDRKDKKDEEREKEKEKEKRRSDKGDSRKDKDRKRRSRSRSTERKKKRDDRKERDDHHNGDAIQDWEVMEEPPAPKELTEREKARLKIMEEMKLREDKESAAAAAVGDDPVWCNTKAQEQQPSRYCPYLDTIDRTVLDFDFEKLCSISLSHLNVYACMVCGKYFQGRGTNTHAYTHSLDTDHRVFLNLQTLKFFCLPDNYEVVDPSLDDIKYVLKPQFTDQLVKSLNEWSRAVRAYDDSTYYPGVVGLNNIKENDYENVILHAFSHVPPLRDYFLKEENYAGIKRPPGDKLQELTRRFGELIRKLWNTKAFKAHVSPHEMLQAIVLCSEKKFQFTKQGDAAEFMSFLLNTLHQALNGTAKTNSSIVYKTFRGRMRVFTRKVPPVDASEDQRRILMQLPEYQEEMKEQPFLFLPLDLPAAPLYRDEFMQNIIPQVPLHVLLQKFNGQTEKEYKTYNENFLKRFELLSLPQYLVISYKRFHKNQWFVEKNPTIVNFPISNVDLYECVADDKKAALKYTTYDLLANIIHDGPPEAGGRYRTQILHAGTNKWFEMEDLHVKDILPQMITLAESYIQIWRLNTEKTREQRMEEIAPESELNIIAN